MSAPSPRSLFHFGFQEAGLLLVILVLGSLLTASSGKVKVPVFKTSPSGESQRVFTTNATGEREARFEEKNKFLNAQNLSQLAKDTSFIAIMAVGATIVIISGGIDLSVGAIYALASVLGALVLHYYGPDGVMKHVTAQFSVPLGILCCVGTGAICCLLNGGMIVALRVHPFIITLGTMAIFSWHCFC